MFRMKTGIDHQPARAEQFGVERSELADRVVVVPAVLDRQTFRIQAPAFAGRREIRRTDRAAGILAAPCSRD